MRGSKGHWAREKVVRNESWEQLRGGPEPLLQRNSSSAAFLCREEVRGKGRKRETLSSGGLRLHLCWMTLARGRDFPGQFLWGTHSCPSYKLHLDLVA